MKRFYYKRQLVYFLILITGCPAAHASSQNVISEASSNYDLLHQDDEILDGSKVFKIRRNAPSESCPRDEAAVERLKRTCLRKCNSDADCLSRKKVCICDGVCGMSCIKPDKECSDLTNPVFGFVEVTGQVVGSRAKYKCQQGYHLIGEEERVCQADGTWSRSPPECQENLYCTNPKLIPNARHDAPESQTRFEVNHTLQYSCFQGYITKGFSAAKCFLYNGTMQWFGPELECLPISCGEPGDIANGYKEGICFSFSCRVTYHCRPGFELVGRNEHFCQHDGVWSPPELPTCARVQCEIPRNPENGKAVFRNFSFNDVVTYECNYGYMLVGPQTRRCGPDRQWSGKQPACQEINCGHPGPLYNGWVRNIEQGVSLGSTIIFQCFDNMTLEGESSAVCQSDGTWSKPLPKCLAACIVPSITHGAINNSYPQEKVPHGFVLEINCDVNYELAFGNSLPVCYNSTWNRAKECQPARCKSLPRRPRYGIVIAHKTEHGMRAKFRCKDGFKLVGERTTICHYGNWTGSAPTCKEVYCKFPGKIENGRVLLVGNMGLYDYREYVTKVKNNRQIRYDCNKGFYLVDGPPGATCVAGIWTPRNLPRCIPDLHPRIRLNKRSTNDSDFANISVADKPENSSEATESGSRYQDFGLSWALTHMMGVGQRIRNSALDFVRIMRDRENEDESALRRIRRDLTYEERIFLKQERKRRRKNMRWEKKQGKRKHAAAHCEPIPNEPFMRIEILRQGRDTSFNFSSGVRLKITCLHGYGLNIGNKTAKCTRGEWRPKKPECVTLPCVVPGTSHGKFKYNDQIVEESNVVSHGEVVKFYCEEKFSVLGSDTMRCWYGEWAVTGQNPECQPEPCELPHIENGQFLNGYKKGLAISHGSSVDFECLNGLSKNVTEVKCEFGKLLPDNPACVVSAMKLSMEVKRPEKRNDDVINIQSMAFQDSNAPAVSVSLATTAALKEEIREVQAVENPREQCHTPMRITGALIYHNDIQILKDASDNDHQFQDGITVTYNCVSATNPQDNTHWSIRCENGKWIGIMDRCNITEDEINFGNKSCVWNKLEDEMMTFYNDELVNEDHVEFSAGTELSSRCIDIGKYAISGSPKLRCVHGEWDGVIPSCTGLSQIHNYSMNMPPTILIRHFRGPIAQTNDGSLMVYPNTVLYLECLWIRRFGTPSWNVTKTTKSYQVRWTTEPIRNAQLEYRLSIYKAKSDDTGTYACTTPSHYTHFIKVLVEAVHCPYIETENGLRVDTTETRMSTTVNFSCDPGFELVGDNEVYCKSSGNWSDPFPTCQKVRCKEPLAPENGIIKDKSPFHTGDTIHVSCIPNHMMEGQPFLVCQENGQWSGTMPKCLEACTYPGTIISGTMSSVKFYYAIGDVITYTCSVGFVLEGARAIECLEGARWSDDVPTCLPDKRI